MQEKSRVTLGEDGKYRWVCSLNLFTNLTVFWIVWKIFFVIIVGIFTVVIIADVINFKDMYASRTLTNIKYTAFFIAGMTALSLIGYYLYSAMMGGKYTVEFTMDEKGITHSQIPSQAKKAKKIGAATALLGAASGNMAAAGVGVNATRTEMYSEFSKVRKVKPCPRKCLIKVNGVLNHNQVYTAKEDFDFVKDYIISHCDNIKK